MLKNIIMKQYCLQIIISLFSTICLGQNYAITQVQIGDKIPATVLKNFLPDTTLQKNLSEFYKGKLLIIDFWATWCSPCLTSLHKLDSLKSIFKDKIEVLAVTYEDRSYIKTVLEKLPALKKLDVNYLTDDTLIHAYFRHRILPHLVWVDSSGIVRAITSRDEETSENIQAMMSNKNFNLPEKKDLIDFDWMDTFHVADAAIKYRSILTLTPEGISNGGILSPLNVTRDKKAKYNRFFHFGQPLIDLYVAAGYLLSAGDWSNPYRYNLQIKDSIKVLPTFMVTNYNPVYSKYEVWAKENAYSYELIMPTFENDTTIFKYVMEDLNRCLPFTAKMKDTKVHCWIVVNATKESEKLVSKGGESRIIWPRVGYVSKMQNASIDELIFWLNYHSKTYMILNETKNKLPVDMDLELEVEFDRINIDDVRSKLKKYGFDIIKADRVIPLLTITDK